jgi:hypothetical protein
MELKFMTIRHDRQEIAEQIRGLTGDQVKTLVLSWLSATEASLMDFEQLLENEYPQTPHEDTMIYGELDETLEFHPLTEEQMIQKSLNALEEYQATGDAVPHQHVQEWADSLGTGSVRPCPR